MLLFVGFNTSARYATITGGGGNLKVCDIINCLNKNVITHLVRNYFKSKIF